ncbi:SGNH/GDSL hydrolase family protein [Pseudodesulfovibrio pelocollis]|uniref:SGNH/GDSL hydrolase family protein n=1 Tax=Pseudodesulfovibrio pelocollis TaxID=3051432 RepID=UPI00255B1AF8|nr:SGNH/GDSL hydrolase family protein [Pseudodesulfovibrio sp. SB368]
MLYLLLAVLLLALAEIKARKRYLKIHGLGFRPRRIGEYPYREFIEECGPPLFWRLAPGYASAQVHINSLGQRGPEPQPGRRRIWFVGESELFGAKLPDEARIWFKALQKRLDEAGADYQVMNASIIGYNGRQAAEAVWGLPLAKGDILVIRPNLNDASIARVNGADWEPGMPWPMAFIHKLERRAPWYIRLMDRSCLGTLLRRRMGLGARGGRFATRPGFQADRLRAYMKENLDRMVEYSGSRGARVAMLDFAPVYSPRSPDGDEGGLSAIQANWRNFVGEWSAGQFQALEYAVDAVAGPRGLPVLRTGPHLWSHPRRFHLYLDLVHLTAEGHEALAQAMFEELRKTDLLEGEAA